MGINKYNSEGYYDPTVYEALSNIEKEEKAARRIYRPLVYICSPYAGNVEQNVNMARVYSRFAVKIPAFRWLLICFIRSSWMTAVRQSGNLPCSWGWCYLPSVSRCGCLAVSFPPGWRRRLQRRKRKRYRCGISQRNWRRLKGNANDVLYSELPGKCEEQSVSK